MSYEIIIGKIEDQNVDIIVNASNAIGFMGGFIGKHIRMAGVSESLHYVSNGLLEKEAKEVLKNNNLKRGDIFVTSGANLKAKYIIHAITMNFPGQKSKEDTIEKLLPCIIAEAHKLGAKSIAVPLLGAGTGRISKDKILFLYDIYFGPVQDLQIIVVTL